jgi:hypothetical protein
VWDDLGGGGEEGRWVWDDIGRWGEGKRMEVGYTD